MELKYLIELLNEGKDNKVGDDQDAFASASGSASHNKKRKVCKN